jgi:hypothetical protein
MNKIFTLFFPLLLSSVLNLQAQGIRINELDYDQPSTDSEEFIELYNSDSFPADLNICTVILFNGGNSSIYDSIPLPSFTLNPGEYYVICGGGNSVPNCNLAHGSVSDMIQNGSPDAVAIKDNITQTIFDALSYEGSCVAPYVEGTGVATSDADNNTTPYVSLSRFPDGMDTDNNSIDFNLACITPGTANVDSATGCLPAGIPSTGKNESILYVYPNPASATVSIFGMPSTTKDWTVSVIDASGRLCIQTNAKPERNIISFNVESLSNGLYQIVLTNSAMPLYSAKRALTVNK